MGQPKKQGALSSATTTIFTAPAKTNSNQRILWQLQALTLNNDSGSTSVINIYHVPSGGSLADTNKLVNGLSMTDNSSFSSTEGEKHYFLPGDTLQITASAPHASLVYTASFHQVNVFLE
jgi:archaellum component FlaF (FlaF/FlaG flagellin family)